MKPVMKNSLSLAKKPSLRYRMLSENLLQVTYPDGQRIKLFLDSVMQIADISGPRRILSLRQLCSLLNESDCVLELGCGDGFSSHFLSHQVRSVMALDWQKEWIHYAARRYHHQNLQFISLPVMTDPLQLKEHTSGKFDKVALFNPLTRGLEVGSISELFQFIEAEWGKLPLFWSEQLPLKKDESDHFFDLMAECLGKARINDFMILKSGNELMTWPKDWTSRYPLDFGSVNTHMDLVMRILDRLDAPLVFGPGIPDSWPIDFFLLDYKRIYGRWCPGETVAVPLFKRDIKAEPVPLGTSEMIYGFSEEENAVIGFGEAHGPSALWYYGNGKDHLDKLKERLLSDLKKGHCVEGYAQNDGPEMLVRVNRRERLPLYPLFDTTLLLPKAAEITSYLEWTKKKAQLTVTPQAWTDFGSLMNGQDHRGLLILVNFCESDLKTIMAMASAGWRIGLGANQPIDQVPLQSFEKFRLLLEYNGVDTEALWMGVMPPDPAYIKNIYSRFGRLLISTRCIQKSWDSKRIRFCLTLGAGDDLQLLVRQAYYKMAGLEELDDYLMLYAWASVLEKAGQRQAAKLLFTTLSNSRVPSELEPKKRQAGVYYHLGRIAEAESDLPLAVRYYKHCLSLESTYLEASERLACLNHPGRAV